MTDVRRITASAGVHAAAALFDDAPRLDATDRFPREPGHHLLVAYVEGALAAEITTLCWVGPSSHPILLSCSRSVQGHYVCFINLAQGRARHPLEYWGYQHFSVG